MPDHFYVNFLAGGGKGCPRLADSVNANLRTHGDKILVELLGDWKSRQ